MVSACYLLGQEKTLVSRNAGDKKNLHPGSHKFTCFNQFSGNIIFSSLVSLAFLYSCFFFFVFWNGKNIFWYTSAFVMDDKFSPGQFLETRLLFLALLAIGSAVAWFLAA